MQMLLTMAICDRPADVPVVMEKNCTNIMRPGKISVVLLLVLLWKKQSKWANPMRV